MSRIAFSISPIPTDSGIPSILKLDLLEYCSMLSLADSTFKLFDFLVLLFQFVLVAQSELLSSLFCQQSLVGTELVSIVL